MNKIILNKEIYKFSNKVENQIKLSSLLNYDFNLIRKKVQLKNNFKNDLLIRLSKRTTELENLPYGLSAMPSISKLTNCYINSFRELYQFENLENDKNFVNLLNNIYKRHADTSDRITDGLKEWNSNLSEKYDEDIFDYLKKNGHLPFGCFKVLNNSIDKFYTNRFSVRLLIDQYINYNNKNKDFVGIINKKICPSTIVNEAVADALEICRYNYEEYPDININLISETTITYIPSYLYYVLFELIKNAIRATMENNKEPIEIIISGETDVIIKISDKGKGIKYSDIDKVWFYSYTSVSENYYNNKLENHRPMAGFGFGLPVSRATIKFLGGDIKLMSVENYGTDVYISLPSDK